jgi:hypothetical protein
MISNLDKYKKDLELLIERGNSLYLALSYEQDKPGFEKLAKKKWGDRSTAFLKGLPNFQGA